MRHKPHHSHRPEPHPPPTAHADPVHTTPDEIRRLLDPLIAPPADNIPVPRRVLVFGFLAWLAVLIVCGRITHLPDAVATFVAASYPAVCVASVVRWKLASMVRWYQARRGSRPISRWFEICVDPGFVGPALEAAFEAPDSRIRKAAVSALIRLLPRMTEEGGARLTSEQRYYLRETLDHSMLYPPGGGDRFPTPYVNRYVANNLRLTAAALPAIGIARDLEAIPYLQSIVRQHAHTDERRHIQELAIGALEILEDEQRKRQEAETLLRPATSPADSQTILVRPATSPAPAESDRLLHVTDGEMTQ